MSSDAKREEMLALSTLYVTAPAPLAAAIEEARQVVAIVDVCRCGCGKGECCAAPYGNALRSLLLALDAVRCVPGVICPTCLELAKAEAALGEIADNRCDCESATDGHSNDCPRRASVKTRIARRYFAEKGEVNG